MIITRNVPKKQALAPKWAIKKPLVTAIMFHALMMPLTKNAWGGVVTNPSEPDPKPEPEPEPICAIGDVFYADWSCGNVNDYTQDSGKTPVGVVYYVSDEGKHGKVINLKNLGRQASNKPFDPANPYNTKYRLYWGYYTYELEELPNYDKTSIVEKLKAYDPDLYDGKGNTDKILAAEEPNCRYEDTTDNLYYKYCIPQAAKAAHDFYPLESLKNDSKVGQGKWYLPAIGELMELYGYDNSHIADYVTSGAKGDHKKLVNNTLDALKGKGVVAEKLIIADYWSSSEYNRSNSWKLDMDTGGRYSNIKSDENYVRVSLQY